MRTARSIARSFATGAFALLSAGAQAAETDFSGKTITVVVGFGAGGGYDTIGRLVGDHLGRFLPGEPSVVVENMPGGGGLRSVAYLVSAAPRDGTVLTIVPSSIAFDGALGNLPDGIKASDLTYIGRLSAPVGVGITWHTSAAKTFADAREHKTVMASSGATAISSIVPRLANARMGTKFEVVEGYTGSPETALAMERGEVDGQSTNLETIAATHPDWLEKGLINILWVQSRERVPDFPDIPALSEFAETDEDRMLVQLVSVSGDIGRSLGAPPGLPADTVATLRAAFDRMVEDPAFIAQAERLAQELNTATGAEIEAIVTEATAIPSSTVDTLVEIITPAAQ